MIKILHNRALVFDPFLEDFKSRSQKCSEVSLKKSIIES